MPYIGNDLATQFQAFATQTITGDGSTSYTLDRAVANGKELLVYINNVKQEEGSGKSYEASGTTITFSEAVASGDSCYLVYMGSAQQTVVPPDGSVSSAKLDTNIAVSGDLTVDTNTLFVDSSNNRVGIGTTSPSQSLETTGSIFINSSANPFLEVKTSGAGNNPFVRIKADSNYWDLQTLFSNTNDELDFRYNGTSTMMIDKSGAVTKPLQPAFRAYTNADQSNFAVNTTHTLVFGAETFDQNGDFASNTFTAPVTGKYLLGYHLRLESPNQAQVYTDIRVVTSNRTAQYLIDQPAIGSSDYYTVTSMQLYDMDANDTAHITLYNSGGSAGMDITGFEQHGLFYGHLVC